MGYNPNYKWNVCRVNPHQSLGWTNPLTKWDIHINHWGYNPLTKWDEPPSSIPLFGRKLQFIAPLPTGPTPDISSAPNLAQQTDLTWSRTRLWNRAVPRGLSIKHWQYINEYMGCYGYVCVCIYYIYTLYIYIYIIYIITSLLFGVCSMPDKKSVGIYEIPVQMDQNLTMLWPQLASS